MKKFFIALSMLAALALSVAPSQALIGMPDDVPGFEIIQGFFVVEVNGSLDTAVIIQEVGNAPGAGQTANLHWHIFDRRSNHLADARSRYTRNDVEAFSVRDLIANYVTEAGRTALLTTLDGAQVYVGYIVWENDIRNGAGTRLYTNNLISKMYLHDMPAGRAAMVNLAAREYMPSFIPDNQNAAGVPAVLGGTPIPYTWNNGTGIATPVPWLAQQGQAGTTTGNEAEFFAEYGNPPAPDAGAQVELFSPDALAASAQRERGYTALVPGIANATDFAMYPRYYLYDENAQDFIFLWKSVNNIAPAADWRFDINIFDTLENPISGFIVIPDELNIFDVRDLVPPAWLMTYPVAGWISIAIPDIYAGTGGEAFATIRDIEFLGYNWQYANAAGAALNWSGLYQVARDVNYRFK